MAKIRASSSLLILNKWVPLINILKELGTFPTLNNFSSRSWKFRNFWSSSTFCLTWTASHFYFAESKTIRAAVLTQTEVNKQRKPVPYLVTCPVSRLILRLNEILHKPDQTQIIFSIDMRLKLVRSRCKLFTSLVLFPETKTCDRKGENWMSRAQVSN